MRYAAWLAALICCGAWSTAAAQAPAAPQAAPADAEPTVTLHVTSRVVAISAVVKAKDGTPVQGLTRDDFSLKQDGKDQAIRYFSLADDLPLTFALLVDVSGSQRTFIGDTSLASDVFFRTILGRPQDRAMLVEFDAGLTQLMGLTNDPNRLHLALTSLGLRPEKQGATVLYDSVYAACNQVLNRIKGRKAIVLLTDGDDVGSRIKIDQAIEEAQKGNVQIYSVYYSIFDVGGRPMSRPGGLQDEGLDTLRRLSAATGGRVFHVAPGMGLQSIYRQIETDLRTQYELGYTPPPDTAPGKFHKLELHVKQKGDSVQAKSGFIIEP
jgi:Ca-activated chloride channel family protein